MYLMKKQLLFLVDKRLLSFFEENKIGNEKFKVLGLEVYDPSLSQFIIGGSGSHCLSFELIRE